MRDSEYGRAPARVLMRFEVAEGAMDGIDFIR